MVQKETKTAICVEKKVGALNPVFPILIMLSLILLFSVSAKAADVALIVDDISSLDNTHEKPIKTILIHLLVRLVERS